MFNFAQFANLMATENEGQMHSTSVLLTRYNFTQTSLYAQAPNHRMSGTEAQLVLDQDTPFLVPSSHQTPLRLIKVIDRAVFTKCVVFLCTCPTLEKILKNIFYLLIVESPSILSKKINYILTPRLSETIHACQPEYFSEHQLQTCRNILYIFFDPKLFLCSQ